MAARHAYRPDLDGLRAVAVLAVLAFHAFPKALPGGFAGVDVFFVISGFLISGIIFEALRAGRFSFADFYWRRVRRIFPALVLVLAACLGLGCTLPDPSATVVATCPSRASFTSVAPFLETGCGTIDCHGQPSRPLRIMGYNGLRLSPTDIPGGNPTTVAEVDANWESVCGLQPELMTQVEEGQAPAGELLLLMKPLGQTNHKGGTVIMPGDDGDTCLTSWLGKDFDDVDVAACARASAAQ